MTKKDFELIARVFAATHGAGSPLKTRAIQPQLNTARDDLALRMADALATTNPAFDRARFLAACEGRTRRVKGEYVHA